MATPADQRLLELLDKWLASLELHGKYCSLDAASYWKVQPWPEHERPSRWIIDVAKQKTLALKAQIGERIAKGDETFADSLELMTFLANLVGSEHIERFIPLATGASEGTSVAAGPPAAAATPAAGEAPASAALSAATGTREMPKFIERPPRKNPATGTPQVARTERKPAVEPKPAARGVVKPKGPAAAAKAASPVRPASEAKHSAPRTAAPEYTSAASATAARDQVIADATRLVQWGRKWYELAELIASMADRPPLTDVRRILKDHKALIDEKAGRR